MGKATINQMTWDNSSSIKGQLAHCSWNYNAISRRATNRKMPFRLIFALAHIKVKISLNCSKQGHLALGEQWQLTLPQFLPDFQASCSWIEPMDWIQPADQAGTAHLACRANKFVTTALEDKSNARVPEVFKVSFLSCKGLFYKGIGDFVRSNSDVLTSLKQVMIKIWWARKMQPLSFQIRIQGQAEYFEKKLNSCSHMFSPYCIQNAVLKI